MLYGGLILATFMGFAGIGLLTDHNGSDDNYSDTPDDDTDGSGETLDPLTSTDGTDDEEDVTVETGQDGTVTITVADDVEGTLYAIKTFNDDDYTARDSTDYATLDFYLVQEGTSFPIDPSGDNPETALTYKTFVENNTPVVSLDLGFVTSGEDDLGERYSSGEFSDPSVVINNANVDVEIIRVDKVEGRFLWSQPNDTLSPNEPERKYFYGNLAQNVSEDTSGTDGHDWFIATNDTGESITIDGKGDDDRLTADGANVTLIGGSGDDDLTANAANSVIQGGEGNDRISANDSSVISAGAGADYVRIDTENPDGATASLGDGGDGGDGASVYYHLESSQGSDASISQIVVHGDSGDDRLSGHVSGVAGYGDHVEIFGDSGDDSLAIGAGGAAFGGVGNDILYVDRGGSAHGNSGDDILRALHRGDDGDSAQSPFIITGEGNDLVEILISHPGTGDNYEGAVVTDFNPETDVLRFYQHTYSHAAKDWYVSNVVVEVADDNSYSTVKATVEATDALIAEAEKGYYVDGEDNPLPIEPFVVTVRLDGVTTLTADAIELENPEDARGNYTPVPSYLS